MHNFLDLSPEIILAIASHLLPYPDPENPIYREPDFSSSKANREALSHLSQTCKTLRELVQPVLYRCPFTEYAQFPSLVRTIFQRPDLAHAVREMHVGIWELERGAELPAEDVKFFQDLLSKHAKNADGSPIIVAEDWYRAEKDLSQQHEDELYISTPQAALSGLVLTQTPNIETLRLDSYYTDYCFFCQPNSLPRLKYLYYKHGDTEMGNDLAMVKNICLAAPNLQQLDAFMIAGVSETIPHTNIKKLSIGNSAILEEEFIPLFSGFNNLDSFSYDSGGAIISDQGEATPQNIAEILIRYNKKTLKHFSLNISSACLDENGEDDLISNLQQLEVLESLDIDYESVYLEPHGESADYADTFTKLLPRSIQEFTFTMPDFSCEAPLLRLAKAVPELFSRLKSLTLVNLNRQTNRSLPDTVYEDKDLLRDAFAASGVQVFHRSYFVEKTPL